MRCVMYAPWFGPLPWYTEIFMGCCAKAPQIQWVVPSDQPRPESAPTNVLWVLVQDLTVRIEDFFKIGINEREWGHKLCDLKPFWHRIFAPYDAPNYEYYGWCDWDVVHDLSPLEFNFKAAKFTRGPLCSPLFIQATGTALEWYPSNLKRLLAIKKSCAWDEVHYLPQVSAVYLQEGLTPEVDLYRPARYAVHMYRAKHLPPLYAEWLAKYFGDRV